MADRIDVRHVARLARLALTDEEVETYGAQLGNLLTHVDALRSLDLASVSATAQVVAQRNVEREDEVRPTLPREDALAGAPQRQGGFFKVPRILAAEG